MIIRYTSTHNYKILSYDYYADMTNVERYPPCALQGSQYLHQSIKKPPKNRVCYTLLFLLLLCGCVVFWYIMQYIICTTSSILYIVCIYMFFILLYTRNIYTLLYHYYNIYIISNIMIIMIQCMFRVAFDHFVPEICPAPCTLHPPASLLLWCVWFNTSIRVSFSFINKSIILQLYGTTPER